MSLITADMAAGYAHDGIFHRNVGDPLGLFERAADGSDGRIEVHASLLNLVLHEQPKIAEGDSSPADED